VHGVVEMKVRNVEEDRAGLDQVVFGPFLLQLPGSCLKKIPAG